jgi:hypothetical protein
MSCIKLHLHRHMFFLAFSLSSAVSIQFNFPVKKLNETY